MLKGQKKQKKEAKKKKEKVLLLGSQEGEEKEETYFMNFEDDFWPLVEDNGSVAYFHKNECEELWRTLTPEQQQAVCNAIQRKLNSGLFVHYNPTKAIRDNLPKAPKVQIISADEYYRRYHTQTNHDGWVRTFLPEQQKTIYVKQ